MASGTRAQTTRGRGRDRGSGKQPASVQQPEDRFENVEEVARPHAEDYDFEADSEVPAWAKYMMRTLGNRIEDLGDYVTGVDGEVKRMQLRTDDLFNNLETAPAVQTTTLPGIRIVDDAPPATAVTATTAVGDFDDAWSRRVEKFTKLKPPSFSGKKDASAAARWKDSIEKLFDVIGAGPVDRTRLAVLQLEGAAWEWWKSVTTVAERTTLPWDQFSEKFRVQYVPQTSVTAKEMEFLTLEQGDMTVDEYETKFRELSLFSQDLQLEDEPRKARMFLKGLREDILTVVSVTEHREYTKVVESARRVEQAKALKAKKKEPEKAREAQILTKVKPEPGQEQGRQNNNRQNNWKGKRNFQGNNREVGRDSWKKPRTDDGNMIKGNCWKCGIPGHKGEDFRKAK